MAGLSDNAARSRAFPSDTWRFRLGDTHRQLRLFPCVLLSWVSLGSLLTVQAETLKLATGEFQPYVSASLPGQGLSSQIVRSAFEAAGLMELGPFLQVNVTETRLGAVRGLHA